MGENIFQGGKKGVIDLKLLLTTAGEISLGFKEWKKILLGLVFCPLGSQG